LKRIIVLLAICMVFVLAACSKSEEGNKKTDVPKGNYELKEVKLYSDKVTVSVPKDFEVMSEEMVQIKYPAGNPPEHIFTDKDGAVNVAFNHTQNPLTKKDIEPLIEQMKGIYKAQASEWIDSGTVNVDSKTFGFLEFKIQAADTEIYNYIFLTDLEDRMFMGTFNSTIEKLDDWKPTAKEVLHSVKLK